VSGVAGEPNERSWVRLPRTPARIRAGLPAALRPLFDTAWAHVDLDDLDAVAQFRDDWCRQANLAVGHLVTGLGVEEALYPSPLRDFLLPPQPVSDEMPGFLTDDSGTDP